MNYPILPGAKSPAAKASTNHHDASSASNPSAIAEAEGTRSVDHRNVMIANIGKLLHEDTGDVTVTVGGENGNTQGTFLVHGVIFAAASTVFYKLLFSGKSHEPRNSKIVLPDIGAESFEVIRQYVYTAQATLSADNVVDVLVASRQFGLDALLESCMEHVSSSLDTDNVWSLLVMSDIYDLPALKERCFRFIGTRASMVLKSEQALEVPLQVMVDLVRREDLCAPEITIFGVVQRWVARDDTARRASAMEITRYLRLPLMTLKEIMKIVRPSGLCEMDQIMEAVDYHSDPESHVKEREALLLEQSNAEAHAGGTISPISPTPSSASSSSSNGGGAFDENGGRQLSFDQSRDGAGGGGRFGGAGGDGSGAGGVSGHVEAAAMAVRYQQRAKSTIRSSTGVLWHPEVHGPQITLSNGGRTVYQASSNWNGVVANHQFKNGIHRVSVRIDSMVYVGNIWQAVFGVCNPNAAGSITSAAAFKDISGLVIGTGDKTAAGSIHADSYTVPIKQGAVVSLVYDSGHGSLEFFKDGTSLGVAFAEGIHPPVVPALAIASNCAITLCE